MERTAIARSDELGEGEARRFVARVAGRDVAAFVIRHGGRVRAYVNRCLHRALELDLGEGDFLTPDRTLISCRAHGALYDPATGACAGGLCPQGAGLFVVRVEEEGGTIWTFPT